MLLILLNSSYSLGIDISDGQTVFELIAESPLVVNVHVDIDKIDIEEYIGDNGRFSILTLPGYHKSNIIGSPELPQLNKLIEIPQNASPKVEVIDYEIEYYKLYDYDISYPVFPHQPSLSKSQKSEDVLFEINTDLYSKDGYLNHELVSVDIKGMLRSLRLANLVVRPIAVSYTHLRAHET